MKSGYFVARASRTCIDEHLQVRDARATMKSESPCFSSVFAMCGIPSNRGGDGCNDQVNDLGYKTSLVAGLAEAGSRLGQNARIDLNPFESRVLTRN